MLDFDALNAYLDNDREVIFAVLSVYQEDHGNCLLYTSPSPRDP